MTRFQAIGNSFADLRFAQTGHSASSLPRDPSVSGYRIDDEAVDSLFQPGNAYDWYRTARAPPRDYVGEFYAGATPHTSGVGTSRAGPSGHAGAAADDDDVDDDEF